MQKDQVFKGDRECLCSLSRLLLWIKNTLTPLMDLLEQDQGHWLARDLADKRASLLLARY